MDYVTKVYRRKVIYEDVGNGPPLRANPVPPQNIAQRLQAREIFNGRRPGTSKYLERSMCQSIFPNFTIPSVDKPPCFLRKFTPDGNQFLAFSSDQVSVEIYNFNGPQAAMSKFAVDLSKEHLSPDDGPPCKKQKTEILNRSKWTNMIGVDHSDRLSNSIRDSLFDCFFSLKHRIKVAPAGEQLNRECSLFTEDSRYLIVGSASYIQDEHHHPTFAEMYRNNESVEPNGRYPLEDYSIHIVDLLIGSRTDTINFKVDKIYLSHNQGTYLYNKTLAILSVQHQTVHIYQVDGGEFRHVRSIGRFCDEDDELLFAQDFPHFSASRAFEDKSISTLKHRLLTYIYKQAHASFVETKDPSGLAQFHQHFEILFALRIWKVQLLDEDHLLLKYASAEVVTLRDSEPNSQYCIFAFYCISTTEIDAVYDNNSTELLDLFECFTDNFRNNFLTQEARYCSSPSNNLFAMEIHKNFRQAITSARFGGPAEAIKRILAQLPISAQSYTPSPYLDQSLFSYDDHRVSVMERPKSSGELPIRFFGRDSRLLKFDMYAGIVQRSAVQAGRRLVAFIFHPTAPFAISVQRANSEYIVNFHIRLDINSFHPSWYQREASQKSAARARKKKRKKSKETKNPENR